MNVKTGEILALEVTDGRVHDGKELKALVERVLARGKNVGVKSVLADGAYDSNANFRFLDGERIKPAIRVRRNSVASTKNTNTRNGSLAANKRLPQVEREKKVRTQMDGRDGILINKENVWRTRICNQVSKHGKRDDVEGVIV